MIQRFDKLPHGNSYGTFGGRFRVSANASLSHISLPYGGELDPLLHAQQRLKKITVSPDV
jgi:hypothetical protein